MAYGLPAEGTGYGRQVERVLADAGQGRRRLSLADVLDVGLPAVYQQYGEQLVFIDGRIFDASDPSAPAEIHSNASDEADVAVGVEFGWRHVGDCSCRLCAADRTAHRPAARPGAAHHAPAPGGWRTGEASA